MLIARIDSEFSLAASKEWCTEALSQNKSYFTFAYERRVSYVINRVYRMTLSYVTYLSTGKTTQTMYVQDCFWPHSTPPPTVFPHQYIRLIVE